MASQFLSKKEKTALLDWYAQNKRALPWRKKLSPYKIWISEVMLQQTTTESVKPYFEKFVKKFPTLKHLAQAPLGEIFEAWSGLGYYSRARNLHKSAKILYPRKSFPKNYQELLELPGFGPYTARSVASLAFQEPVGVLDANVIRVFTRRWDLDINWWETKARQQLQDKADQAVEGVASNEMNQALMELGATLCKSQNPQCFFCPWQKNCLALKSGTVETRPKTRPKTPKKRWLWKPLLIEKAGKVALIKNQNWPFLRNQWVFPGALSAPKVLPKKFDFKHSITHNEIFVSLSKNSFIKVSPKNASEFTSKFGQKEILWTPSKEIKKHTPVSLLQKVLKTRRP